MGIYDVYGNVLVSDDYITPEMFGAVGDGVADDTDAFASAIADGRPIKLSAKRYKANIYINRSNVNICGIREKTEIIPADISKPIIRINTETAYSTDQLLRFITIKDINILGGYQRVLGIHARACQNIWLERLHFERCYSGAIIFEGVWDSKVRDCDSWICGNDGMNTDDGLNNYTFKISDTTNMKSNALVIDGCRFEHSPRFLDINGVFQIMITNCKFEAHTRAYGNDSEYSPIRVRGAVKGLHFVNDVFTYNGMSGDSGTHNPLFNNGIPFITVNTEANSSNGERITVISSCQFATQPNLEVVYFSGNETIMAECNFDRCSSESVVIELKELASLSNSDIVLPYGGTAVKIDGECAYVDNLRVYDANEDTTKPLVTVTNNAQRGYAKVLYNGTNRANLAEAGTGGFGIDVEFVGMRKYDHV